MAKYRIKVEALDPAEELRAEYRMGIECDRFCIIADQEDGHKTAINEMSLIMLADIIADDDYLIAAACAARGMSEGRQMAEAVRRRERMRRIVKRLGAMEDDDDE